MHNALYLKEFIFVMRASTTVGSAKVLVSPIVLISPLAIFLKIRRIIFPLLVRGRPGAAQMISGVAKGPIDLSWRKISKKLESWNSQTFQWSLIF
jgi:hypothetical protein